MCAQKTILITGCSRGIGLALVHEYIERGWRVLATCRTPARANELVDLLQKRKQPEAIALDVNDDASINSALQHVQNKCQIKHIDVLFNNAGVLESHGGDISQMTRTELDSMFSTNVSGQVIVAQKFLPLLKAAPNPKVVFMSTIMASLAINRGGGKAGYRITKCALNMVTRMFSGDYPGVTFISMHPGWVQTDMGNSVGPAPLSPASSCRGMADTIEKISSAQNGQFLDYKGQKVNW